MRMPQKVVRNIVRTVIGICVMAAMGMLALGAAVVLQKSPVEIIQGTGVILSWFFVAWCIGALMEYFNLTDLGW